MAEIPYQELRTNAIPFVVNILAGFAHGIKYWKRQLVGILVSFDDRLS